MAGNALRGLAAMLASGLMIFQQAVDTAAPQNADGALLLVNRSWRISSEYYPETRVSHVPGQVRRLRPEAAQALEAMFSACREETGVILVSVSGYRDYEKQERIYRHKLENVRGNVEKADAYVARPGASEHQTGLSMDVGARKEDKKTLEPTFGGTKGGMWLKENCWRFGFILRYDEGWEETTGYAYEPWHVRYVGPEHAAAIHEHSMPLEDYLKLLRQETLLELVSAD